MNVAKENVNQSEEEPMRNRSQEGFSENALSYGTATTLHPIQVQEAPVHRTINRLRDLIDIAHSCERSARRVADLIAGPIPPADKAETAKSTPNALIAELDSIADALNAALSRTNDHLVRVKDAFGED